MDHNGKEIVEPLAKFHAKVYVKGRIRIISNERDFFELQDGDIIKIIIRSIDKKSHKILKRAYFEGMITSGGNITIPKDLMQELNIRKGDIVEVLIVGYQKLHEILPVEQYALLKRLSKGTYRLITSDEEKLLLESITSILY